MAIEFEKAGPDHPVYQRKQIRVVTHRKPQTSVQKKRKEVKNGDTTSNIGRTKED